jgi:sensor histidine kinase regulating citrate/malate metabolism
MALTTPVATGSPSACSTPATGSPSRTTVGIPHDERDRVFERGYSTADGGTGYGLAIVTDLAEAHGWDVSVGESESGGARFEVETA